MSITLEPELYTSLPELTKRPAAKPRGLRTFSQKQTDLLKLEYDGRQINTVPFIRKYRRDKLFILGLPRPEALLQKKPLGKYLDVMEPSRLQRRGLVNSLERVKKIYPIGNTRSGQKPGEIYSISKKYDKEQKKCCEKILRQYRDRGVELEQNKVFANYLKQEGKTYNCRNSLLTYEEEKADVRDLDQWKSERIQKEITKQRTLAFIKL